LEEFEVEINGNVIKGSLGNIKDIFKADIPKVKNDLKEIRIKRLKGRISMISFIIIPIPDEKTIGAKEEIKSAKNKTFINCPFKDDIVNCAYQEKDISKVDCLGIIVKLD